MFLTRTITQHIFSTRIKSICGGNCLSSFEKTLPSLVGAWKGAGEFPKDWIVVPVLCVSRRCLDKKLTIDRIRACEEEIWYELMSMTRNTRMFDVEGDAATKAHKLIRMIIEDIQK